MSNADTQHNARAVLRRNVPTTWVQSASRRLQRLAHIVLLVCIAILPAAAQKPPAGNAPTNSNEAHHGQKPIAGHQTPHGDHPSQNIAAPNPGGRAAGEGNPGVDRHDASRAGFENQAASGTGAVKRGDAGTTQGSTPSPDVWKIVLIVLSSLEAIALVELAVLLWRRTNTAKQAGAPDAPVAATAPAAEEPSQRSAIDVEPANRPTPVPPLVAAATDDTSPDREAADQFRRELEKLKWDHQSALDQLTREHNIAKSQWEKTLETTREEHRNVYGRAQKQETALAARLRTLTDPEEALRKLAARTAAFPPAMETFASGVIDIAGQLHDNRLDRLTSREGLLLLDQYVYSAAPPMTRLESTQGGEITVEDVQRLHCVQTWIHHQLRENGIYVINPATYEPVDVARHYCPEADIIWLTDDSVPHNTVAHVKRLGYDRMGEVLRKAEAARYVRVGMDTAPGISPTPATAAEPVPPVDRAKIANGAAVSSSLPAEDSADEEALLSFSAGAKGTPASSEPQQRP